MQNSRPLIYSMTLDVAYKKNKRTTKRESWAVSRHNTPESIMANCTRTMNRLKRECYGKTYKGKKHIIVRGVSDIKTHGYVNSNAI